MSNGDVTAALKAPVLLVGKSGVGDAVDSYNLNACFFEARGVRVLGGVFNRISTAGYYSLERCREVCTLGMWLRVSLFPRMLRRAWVVEAFFQRHVVTHGA